MIGESFLTVYFLSSKLNSVKFLFMKLNFKTDQIKKYFHLLCCEKTTSWTLKNI